MPGHGLTAIPISTNIKQITDVPIQPYSNNVGMYGVYSPFFIFPQPDPGAPLTTPGKIGSIALAGDEQIQLGQHNKITAHINVTGGDLGPLTVAYYNGKPGNGGKLFDVQRVAHVAANGAYQHRVFFHPDACGDYILYAQVFGPGIRASVGQSPTIRVGFDPITAVQALITGTGRIKDGRLRAQLLHLLDSALLQFRQYRIDAGDEILHAYADALNKPNQGAANTDAINRLLSPASLLLDCNAHANPPRLVVNHVLSRDAQSNVIADFTLTNSGTTTAAHARVTVANIGSTSATLFPAAPVDIAPDSSVSLKLVFPASAGDTGQPKILTVGGNYGGGSFKSTFRIVLP